VLLAPEMKCICNCTHARDGECLSAFFLTKCLSASVGSMELRNFFPKKSEIMFPELCVFIFSQNYVLSVRPPQKKDEEIHV
jgi:hypothetical protein